MPSDIEIAQQAHMRRISEVARDKLGIDDEHLEPYGYYKAKISLDYVDSLKDRPDGKLILVTAISPTPAGEGKTTTTVGLGDALNRIGKKASICLREPSLGPVFGMKGGAAGGGYAQVVPMEDINLHFTGDFGAIGLAHNLLSAMIDNHIHHGNELNFDVRRIAWKRVVDMNDRALRQITVGLGGVANGFPREDGFDIVVASEIMAIFCLATSIKDLKDRLGRIVIGYTRDQKPIHAADLNAHGAMAVLLKNALKPNLVQTLENNPAFIHGGPFANIAHGCNSVLATKTALKLVRLCGDRGGLRRRSWRREICRHQMPKIGPAPAGGGDRRDDSRPQISWRRGAQGAQHRKPRCAVKRRRQSGTSRQQHTQSLRTALHRRDQSFHLRHGRRDRTVEKEDGDITKRRSWCAGIGRKAARAPRNWPAPSSTCSTRCQVISNSFMKTKPRCGTR